MKFHGDDLCHPWVILCYTLVTLQCPKMILCHPTLSPGCPTGFLLVVFFTVTSCGVPPTKAGARYLTMSGGTDYDPANIFYRDRLYFTCPNSALSGTNGGVGVVPPIANPNVICQDTGVWAFGSLECAGEYK